MTWAKVALAAAIAVTLVAKQKHAASLVWTDNLNVSATYNVYRSAGACSSDLRAYTRIAAVAAKTYRDAISASGNYCYEVTAVKNGVESPASNSVLVVMPR